MAASLFILTEPRCVVIFFRCFSYNLFSTDSFNVCIYKIFKSFVYCFCRNFKFWFWNWFNGCNKWVNVIIITIFWNKVIETFFCFSLSLINRNFTAYGTLLRVASSGVSSGELGNIRFCTRALQKCKSEFVAAQQRTETARNGPLA